MLGLVSAEVSRATIVAAACAVTRGVALLGSPGKGDAPAGPEAPSAEAAARLQAIVPVLEEYIQAAVEGCSPRVAGDDRVRRNVAEHDFHKISKFAHASIADFRRAQRGSRGSSRRNGQKEGAVGADALEMRPESQREAERSDEVGVSASSQSETYSDMGGRAKPAAASEVYGCSVTDVGVRTHAACAGRTADAETATDISLCTQWQVVGVQAFVPASCAASVPPGASLPPGPTAHASMFETRDAVSDDLDGPLAAWLAEPAVDALPTTALRSSPGSSGHSRDGDPAQPKRATSVSSESDENATDNRSIDAEPSTSVEAVLAVSPARPAVLTENQKLLRESARALAEAEAALHRQGVGE